MAVNYSKKTKKNKKKKKSNNSIYIILLLLAAVALVTVLVLNYRKKKDNTTERTTTENTGYNKSDEYLLINGNDCSLYIGTVIKLSCTSNPASYAESVSWSTTNSEIVSVDNQGRAQVVSEGTAVITAVSGTLSDSIVIIGISKEVQTAANGETVETTEPELPVYIPDDSGNMVPEKPVETQPATEPETKPVETQTQAVTTMAPQHTTTAEPTTSPMQAETVPPTTATEAEINYKDTIQSALPGLGYTKYGNNVEGTYLFEEDGNYLGEIIVNDGFVQIYVQTRTTRFDEAILGLVKCVIPTEYNTVVNAFNSATDNKTIFAEGHQIRIRPANGENHAQLIISY